MPDPERILIIRPSALGDVCRTVPVAAALRRRYPAARIDWVVQSEFADAVRAHPAVSSVIRFDRRGMRKGDFIGVGGWARLGEVVRSVRAPRYDMVIDCQGLARSGFFAWASGARTRIGYANAEECAWVAYTRRVDAPREAHTVDRMMMLAQAAGAPAEIDLRLTAPPEDRDSVPGALRGARYAVVAPTSRWASKRWPADRFARVCARLLESDVVDAIAVLGGPSERDQCEPVLASNDPRMFDLVGRTSVGGLMAVIEGSAIVIANDSAAVHMAVGFDRPMVALFGPTRIDLVGPYGREADVVQASPPAAGVSHKDARHAHLMDGISVETVVRAAADRVSAVRG